MTAVVSQKAVLFAGGEVLLLRDGEWEFPGGRIDKGERPLEALQRELAEETGIDADIGGPVFTAIRERTAKPPKFFVYYHGTTEERSVSLSAEHDAYRWLDPREARELLSERRTTALSRALAER